MRQVWITGPGAVEVREVPEPEPADGEVLVRTAYAGICGSDLHTLHRGHPWLPYPIAPGHEASGLADGERVYLRPAVACGSCFYCGRDRPNLCANLIGIGSHRPGAFADAFTVPAAALAPVPEGVSLAAAAMIEPLATAVHATTVAGGVAGATVTVLGGGTIGQCVLIAALAAGAARVVLTDPVEAKRELAVSLGAAVALEPASEDGISATLDGRPDVVFDCVATRGSLDAALRLAMRGGTVVVVGVGHGPVDVTVEELQDHEIRLAGSAMYVPDDFTAAERLVAAGAPVERLITSVRPLDEAPDALRAVAAGGEVKIHLGGTP